MPLATNLLQLIASVVQHLFMKKAFSYVGWSSSMFFGLLEEV